MSLIGKGQPLRLTPRKLETGSLHTHTIANNIRGYNGGLTFPEPAPFVTGASSSYSWKGRPLGGPERFGWPLVGSPAFEAAATGFASEEDLYAYMEGQGKVFTRPKGYPGASGQLRRMPRTLVFNAYWGPNPALLSEILTDLEDAGVFFLEGSILATSVGAGFWGCLPLPMDSISLTNYPQTDTAVDNNNSFDVAYTPDDWIGGEVLVCVQTLVNGPSEPAFNYCATSSTPSFPTYVIAQDAIDQDIANLEKAAARFNKFKYVVFNASDNQKTAADSDWNNMVQNAANQAASFGGELLSFSPYGGDPSHTIGDDMIKDKLIATIRDFFGL